MKVSILGSGSAGNATFFDVKGTKILIDAGFSCKKIEEKLSLIGEKLEDISAILITHEHGDHIGGAGIISRKYNIPVYITVESYQAASHKIGEIAPHNLRYIDGSFKINDTIRVYPFDVMHDAVRTLGFRLQSSDGKVATIATDIGYVTNIVREHFKNSDVIVIECNYDYHMLMNCSYPWDLKARVKSRTGHLSNIDAANLISELHHEGLKKAYLVHVSKDSNNYQTVINTVRDHLDENKLELQLEVATQDVVTEIYHF